MELKTYIMRIYDSDTDELLHEQEVNLEYTLANTYTYTGEDFELETESKSTRG